MNETAPPRTSPVADPLPSFGALMLGCFIVACWPVSWQPVASAQSIPNSLLENQSRDTTPIAASEETSLLDRLSQGRYSSRQSATLKMWGDRDKYRDLVQAAARQSEPEVAARANWILEQWRRGTTPDMPMQVMRLLQKGDDPAAIVALLELGRFSDAVIGVQESAQSIEFDQIKRQLETAFTTRFPFYIKLALEEDSLEDLLKLIDLSATGKEMAVCRIRLMQKMGIPFDDDSLLPSAASSWVPAVRDQSLISVLLVLGRDREAIQVAEDSNSDELIRMTLMLCNQWQKLSDRFDEFASNPANSAPTKPTTPQVIQWVHALVAADRCGDRQKAEKATDFLKTIPTEHEGFGLAWKALTLHGEIDQALTMLDRENPYPLVDVALAASRPAVVFEKLNYPFKDVEANLDDWIDDAINKQLVDAGELGAGDNQAEARRRVVTRPVAPNKSLEQLMALMKCLIAVGSDDAARTIADRLAQEPILFGSTRNPQPLRDFLIANLVSTSRSDWVLDLAVAEDEKSISATSQFYVARLLPDTESVTVNLLMEAMQKMNRQLPYQRRFQMVCQLLKGEIPEGFDPTKDFEKLFRVLTNQESQGLFAARLRSTVRSQINHDIAKFFARHGESQLAVKCLSQLVRTGDLDALYELAIQEANSGHADRADEFFQVIWDRAQSGSGRVVGLSFPDNDTNAAMKALVGQWQCSKREGDVALAQRLQRQIELTMCSPSTEFGDGMAEFLSEQGAEDIAEETYEALLRLTAMGSTEATEFYDVARKYSTLVREKDPASAIRWFDLAVGGTLESTYFRSSAYVTLPIYIRRWALESSVEAKDRSAVIEHLTRLTQLDPMDISFAEDVLPKMREQGMPDEADEVFDQLFDRGKAHLELFPLDITTGNNVAWVAAINDRRLDEAVEMSERTVYMEPDSAIYRDTLAEILFRLGRKKEALHVEESCVLDDPTQWHLHTQIEKYRSAVDGDAVKTD